MILSFLFGGYSKEEKYIFRKLIKTLYDDLTCKSELENEMILPEDRLKEDLGMDSFLFGAFSFQIHGEMGVEIPIGFFNKLKTIDDVVKYISKEN